MQYDAGRLDKCIKVLRQVDVPDSLEPVYAHIVWMQIRHNYNYARYHGVKWHSHGCYEAHIIYQGEICYQLKSGEEFVLRSNEYLLVQPGTIHKLIRVEECSVSYSVLFTVSSPEEAGFPEEAAKGKAEIYTPLFDLLIAALERNDSASPWIIRNVALSVLLSISMSGMKKSFNRSGDITADKRYLNAVQYINDNVNTDIQSSDVADFVCLSVRQLNRLFQTYANVSLYRYISLARCNAAKELLKDRRLSISYIAEKLAFSSEYSFNRFFNRIEGVPPGRYREMINE